MFDIICIVSSSQDQEELNVLCKKNRSIELLSIYQVAPYQVHWTCQTKSDT